MVAFFEKVIPELTGAHYLDVLRRIHEVLHPETYLEIGTRSGESLERAFCASIAIDPMFQIGSNVIGNKPICHLMQMGSDAFFKNHDPQKMLGQPLDFVFLDGMHWCEFLLRDFMNVEKHCKKNSIIAIHDCIPTDSHIARRDEGDATLAQQADHPDWWAGDVWKAVNLLQKIRPDLRIYALDSHPTGLIVISNLDPESNVIQEKYFEFVEYMHSSMEKNEELHGFVQNLNIISSDIFLSHSEMSRRFWL